MSMAGSSPEEQNRRRASILRGVLNDMKRDAANAAIDLDLPLATVEAALSGLEGALDEVSRQIIHRWPVSSRDLATTKDDAPCGVIVWTQDQAKSSSRLLDRGGRPYYEYRDTAMSRISPIRPEWIKMLCKSEYPDPFNSTLCWNRGHALHQFTYFAGSVDFYWSIAGKRFGRRMQAGDTAVIPSFIPHTFATETLCDDAHIIAVTYSGSVHGDVREELAAVNWDNGQNGTEFGTTYASLGGLLRLYSAEASTRPEEIGLIAGLLPERIAAILNLGAHGSLEEIEKLARALGLPARYLMPQGANVQAGVVILPVEKPDLNHPFCDETSPTRRILHLARSPVTPRARAIELELLPAAGDSYSEQFENFGLHHYGYVLGDCDIILRWQVYGEQFEQRLMRGDSFYMKPWILHAFEAVRNGDTARILSFRAPGAADGEAFRELAALGSDASRLMTGAQDKWYD